MDWFACFLGGSGNANGVHDCGFHIPPQSSTPSRRKCKSSGVLVGCEVKRSTSTRRALHDVMRKKEEGGEGKKKKRKMDDDVQVPVPWYEVELLACDTSTSIIPGIETRAGTRVHTSTFIQVNCVFRASSTVSFMHDLVQVLYFKKQVLVREGDTSTCTSVTCKVFS